MNAKKQIRMNKFNMVTDRMVLGVCVVFGVFFAWATIYYSINPITEANCLGSPDSVGNKFGVAVAFIMACVMFNGICECIGGINKKKARNEKLRKREF